MRTFCFLLGKPASGKGTQIRKIKDDYECKIFSVGESLKDHIARKTELGKKVEHILKDGKLVSDDIVVDLFKDFAEVAIKEGTELVLIDGFPRTVGQYRMIEEYIHQESDFSYMFVHFDVTDDFIFKRFRNRLVCGACYTPFSSTSTGLTEGDNCPSCKKGRLIKRDDDSTQIVGKRMIEYKNLTLPMINEIASEEKECFYAVDASKSEEEIFSEVEKLLQNTKIRLKKI